MWRGHMGRAAAKEQVARLHRRKCAMRTLLHIRCRRLLDRARREELMQLYKQRPVGDLAEPITSLATRAMMQENHDLRQELDRARKEREALVLTQEELSAERDLVEAAHRGARFLENKVEELNCDLTVERRRVSDADGTAIRLESCVAELRSDLGMERERALHAEVVEHGEVVEAAQLQKELANHSEQFVNHERDAEVQFSQLRSDLKAQCECTERWKAHSIQLEERSFMQEAMYTEEVEKLKAQADMLRTDLDVQHKLAKASKQATEEAVLRMGFAVPISSLALYGLLKVCGRHLV